MLDVRNLIRDCRKINFEGDRIDYTKKIRERIDSEEFKRLTYKVTTNIANPYDFKDKYPTIFLEKRGDSYGFFVQVFLLKSQEVPIMDSITRLSACGNCAGYNGTCPIYSPYLANFIGERKLLLFVFVFDYFYMIRSLTKNFTEDFNVRPSIRITNLRSKSRTGKIFKIISEKFKGFNLFLGSCGSCRHCSVLKKDKCKFPKRRTFSLESVGVDCEQIHLNLYGSHLSWYYRGSLLLPNYMVRYCGILVEDEIDPNDVISYLKSKVEEIDFEIKSQSPIIFPSELSLIDFTIPVGYHKGSIQKVYLWR